MLLLLSVVSVAGPETVNVVVVICGKMEELEVRVREWEFTPCGPRKPCCPCCGSCDVRCGEDEECEDGGIGASLRLDGALAFKLAVVGRGLR
jgi:hypothetical protein